jgi:hypothetical protein
MLRGKGAGMGGGGMPRHHLILPHSILQKPNTRMEPFRSSNFSEPNTGSEPFHALGTEPFHSVLPGSRTEHILIRSTSTFYYRLISCQVGLSSSGLPSGTCLCCVGPLLSRERWRGNGTGCHAETRLGRHYTWASSRAGPGRAGPRQSPKLEMAAQARPGPTVGPKKSAQARPE